MSPNHLLYWLFKAEMIDPHDYQFSLVNAPDWVLPAFNEARQAFEQYEEENGQKP